MVRESLKVAQSRQKSYADKRRRDLSFEIGDFVYLKVSPMRGTRRFRVKVKLAPRYVGPFKIIDRMGEVAQLELPPQLSDVHDVFHVSQLKKCLRVPEEQLPMEYLDLGGDLTYSERPIMILDSCHTPFRERGNEASIRVPRMFKSHARQQLINRCNVINKRVIFLT
jgi:hypothetical protein